MIRACCCVALMGALAVTVRAEEPRRQLENAPLTIHFEDAALSEVLAQFENEFGRRIKVTPPVRSSDRVSLRVVKQPLSAVLQQVLSPLGYKWSYGRSISSLGLDAAPELVITSLASGGFAERAGLRVGDVVASAGGFEVRSRSDLVTALERANGPVLLAVKRRGSEGVVELRVDAE
jgi:S1-C subfamily serine protease